MTVPTIPTIPAKMGEAGAYQERLFAILSAMKENIEAGTASSVEIQALQTAVGDETAGLVADVDALQTDVAALETAVGDETAGIVKDIDDLQAKIAANQADSTATDVPGLVADFNTLLASLKAAGLMTADA